MDWITLQTLHFKLIIQTFQKQVLRKLLLCPCCFYVLDLPYSWSLPSVCPGLVSDSQMPFAVGPKITNICF